jgi:NitT/TauT family transport system permease protein
MHPVFIRVFIVAIIAVAWEIAPRLGLVPPVILSPLSASFAVALTSYDVYLNALGATLFEIALAIIFACGAGVIVGGLLGSDEWLRRLILPLASSAYAVPFILLYPLVTLWFGIGWGSKVAYASAYGFFPVLFTTVAGMQGLDWKLITVARAMGARSGDVITKVLVPMATPVVLSAIKIGAAVVITGVITTEMLLSTEGIGFVIAQNRTSFNTPEIYLAIIVCLFIAWGLERVISLVEGYFAGYHHSGGQKPS